jgi:signal transduction histidine kinase
MVAAYLDPGLLGPHVNLTRALFFAYFTYSIVNLIITRVQRGCSWGWRLCVHAMGVAAASLVAISTGGSHSPFLILYLVALLAAAERWGMNGALLTAGACVVLLLAPSLAFASWLDRVPGLRRGGASAEGMTALCASLIIAGYLFGYLAEEDKRRHANALIISRLIGNALPEFGSRATIGGLVHSIRDYFDADQVRLVLRARAGDEAFLWEAKRPRGSREESVQFSKLTEAERGAYFATLPEAVWRSLERRRRGAHDRLGVVASAKRDGGSQGVLSSVAGRLGARRNDFGEHLQDLRVVGEWHTLFVDFSSLLAASFSYQGKWFGRLLVYNSDRGAFHKGDAQFLEALVREVAPAIYSVYHLSRLRSRARATERSRIAHELHDGVIQSLVGMEMQADAVRRQASSGPSRLLKEINRLQELLREEIVDLRERMQLLKPLEVEPGQLVKYLAETVDKFRREQSVAASFVCDSQEVSLSPLACSELVRILQEALVNIRKHSGARTVLVRFGRENETWKLLVEDDGSGFGFTGRLSLPELEAASMGPRVIRERVRSIGGELAIQSVPGCGARLEISLPPRAYELAA